MQFQPLFRAARRSIVPICVVAVFLGITGCTGFFVPTCQEYNDCTSTTTSTTSTTSTTGTTGTTATTSTTSTTSTTGTTSTTRIDCYHQHDRDNYKYHFNHRHHYEYDQHDGDAVQSLPASPIPHWSTYRTPTTAPLALSRFLPARSAASPNPPSMRRHRQPRLPARRTGRCCISPPAMVRFIWIRLGAMGTCRREMVETRWRMCLSPPGCRWTARESGCLLLPPSLTRCRNFRLTPPPARFVLLPNRLRWIQENPRKFT